MAKIELFDNRYAQEPVCVDLKQTVYSLDSPIIEFCGSLFPWNKFRRYRAICKRHHDLGVFERCAPVRRRFNHNDTLPPPFQAVLEKVRDHQLQQPTALTRTRLVAETVWDDQDS